MIIVDIRLVFKGDNDDSEHYQDVLDYLEERFEDRGLIQTEILRADNAMVVPEIRKGG